jgi:nitroimidazol reductase NimA-like FMN-containing flavoprotein (pyridoxamine 5'-phosphate oxidase superfamily)
MRRTDKSGTDSESLLGKAPVCRLGFAAGAPGQPAGPDGEGFPYVVPLHFAWDGEVLYVHCATEGEKLRRLARDDRVCVEIDEYEGIVPSDRPCGFSTRYRSLIAFGRASVVGDREEKSRALGAIVEKYGGLPPAKQSYAPGEIERVAIVRIRLEHLSVKRSGG